MDYVVLSRAVFVKIPAVVMHLFLSLNRILLPICSNGNLVDFFCFSFPAGSLIYSRTILQLSLFSRESSMNPPFLP